MLFIFFYCSQIVSILDHCQKEKGKFFLKLFKRELENQRKSTRDLEYQFVEWKLFSVIQVSSTDLNVCL